MIRDESLGSYSSDRRVFIAMRMAMMTNEVHVGLDWPNLGQFLTISPFLGCCCPSSRGMLLSRRIWHLLQSERGFVWIDVTVRCSGGDVSYPVQRMSRTLITRTFLVAVAQWHRAELLTFTLLSPMIVTSNKWGLTRLPNSLTFTLCVGPGGRHMTPRPCAH